MEAKKEQCEEQNARRRTHEKFRKKATMTEANRRTYGELGRSSPDKKRGETG